MTVSVSLACLGFLVAGFVLGLSAGDLFTGDEPMSTRNARGDDDKTETENGVNHPEQTRIEVCDRASRESKALVKDCGGHGNVPIQSVYELLCKVQFAALEAYEKESTP